MRRLVNFRWACLGITVGYVVWALSFIAHTSVEVEGTRYFSLFDDAMISMRYAWNLSHGAGLVWNAGERVEGYTNLLWTLIMALFTLPGDKRLAVLGIQLLGIPLVLLVAFLSLQLFDRVQRLDQQAPPDWARVLALVGPLAYYPLSYWALRGMETALLSVCLLAAVLLALSCVARPGWPSAIGMAIVLGLAYLTRPDSAVAAGILLVWLAAQLTRASPKRVELARLGVAGTIYASFVLGQEAFRLVYYGALSPNTYTLKLTGMPEMLRLENGLHFVALFLVSITPLAVAVVVDLARAFRPWKALFVALLGATVAYQIWVGGDPWPYWRMLAPAMPLLLGVSAVVHLAEIARQDNRRQGTHARPRLRVGTRQPLVRALALSLLWLGFLVPANAQFWPELVFYVNPYYADDDAYSVRIAVALNQILLPQASIGVTDAGAIPYYAGFHAVDFLGKNDAHIAALPADTSGAVSGYGMTSLPGHNKYDLNYSIQTYHPTYVETFVWGRDDLRDWARERYVRADYRGLKLYLLRNSADVSWVRLHLDFLQP
jgi:hypothetical protein